MSAFTHFDELHENNGIEDVIVGKFCIHPDLSGQDTSTDHHLQYSSS